MMLDFEENAIRKHFSRLTANQHDAIDLIDDVGILPATKNNNRLIVSTDSVISGVHAIGNEPAEIIGRKLLRRCVSDLASKGSIPKCYTLNVAINPDGFTKADLDQWIKNLVDGLYYEQTNMGIYVVGGDTTKLPFMLKNDNKYKALGGKFAQFIISATVYAEASIAKIPHRNLAKEGDLLFITGSIGGAGRGLDILQNSLSQKRIDEKIAVSRYYLPPYRLDLMHKIMKACAVNASIDISDGLLTDAHRLASASGLIAEIDLTALPLDAIANKAINRIYDSQNAINIDIPSSKYDIEQQQNAINRICQIINGGDDYEILFSCPNNSKKQLIKETTAVFSQKYDTDTWDINNKVFEEYPAQVTCIGKMVKADNTVDDNDPKVRLKLASTVDHETKSDFCGNNSSNNTRIVTPELAGFKHLG